MIEGREVVELAGGSKEQRHGNQAWIKSTEDGESICRSNAYHMIERRELMTWRCRESIWKEGRFLKN